MTHHIVLKGKDSFQKEEERDFGSSGAPYTYRTRQYETLERFHEADLTLPPKQLRTIDREFRLRCQLYALGKNIAYYEET